MSQLIAIVGHDDAPVNQYSKVLKAASAQQYSFLNATAVCIYIQWDNTSPRSCYNLHNYMAHTCEWELTFVKRPSW